MNMKKIVFIAMALLSLCACKQEKRQLLPNVSGKAGEVVVMVSKKGWDGELGERVRATLGRDCPYFVMPEPLYTLVNVTPENFTNLFNIHRNILYFKIDSTAVEGGNCELHNDVWAHPQCVIQIQARNLADALAAYEANEKMIENNLEQAERQRIVTNTRRYEQKDIYPKVAEVFGGSLNFPSGYVLRKITDDFAWVEYDRQTSIQGLFIYKYPVSESEPLSLESIVAHRDSMLKANVPGPRDGSYMITSSQVLTPWVEYVKYGGRSFAQTRGWWEVEGDYMGGPFVSESFYSRDGKEIICTEAFLYHPKDEKRLEFRQIEALLYSWSWQEGE